MCSNHKLHVDPCLPIACLKLPSISLLQLRLLLLPGWSSFGTKKETTERECVPLVHIFIAQTVGVHLHNGLTEVKV